MEGARRGSSNCEIQNKGMEARSHLLSNYHVSGTMPDAVTSTQRGNKHHVGEWGQERGQMTAEGPSRRGMIRNKRKGQRSSGSGRP